VVYCYSFTLSALNYDEVICTGPVVITAAPNLTIFAAEAEGGLNLANTCCHVSEIKLAANYITIENEIKELFLSNRFSQYNHSEINFPVKYRKANLIFPSHYFL
jgi:hypothetical protein